MHLIAHRRNTRVLLAETDRTHGVEVDIRSQGPRLVIHHDAFVEGEDFEAWLAEYRHGTLILNVKEEGLEDRLLVLMAEAGISDFFFLDQSFPFLLRTVRRGESRCAVRVSEYEGTETAIRLAGMADWVWLDSFTGALPSAAELHSLRNAGFRLCMVSPELQGRAPEAEIPATKALLETVGVALDAVCTKVPHLWA
jgi:hypothetical protein